MSHPESQISEVRGEAMTEPTSTDIRDRARFDQIRYANVWEDADILHEALDAATGRRILSIASAGDNAFALVAAGAEVVAADISSAQLHLVELKKAAILQLDDEPLLAFLGVRPSNERLEVYARLALALPSESRNYWDASTGAIRNGIIHHGKFENYFRLFRTRVLPLVHGHRLVEKLLQEKTFEERRKFYDERWDGVRWRAMFSVFFSRLVMGRLGRDPEFFRFVEGSVADRIRARAEYAFTQLPTHDNPYLTSIFTGNYGTALPRYLRSDSLASLRSGMNRLTIRQGPIDEVGLQAGGKFDGYNLSDIFEYLDPATTERLYGRLLDTARPGARLAYWNMLVPRRRPEVFADRIIERTDLAKELFLRDRAFFYSAFRIDEVAR